MKKSETPASSILHNVLLIAGFLILFLKRLQIGILAIRFIPASQGLQILGVVLAALNVGFAIWARAILGTNWSDKVSIREGQQLIQKGPYTIVRNPIYTVVIFFMLGAALVLGNVAGILGFGLVCISVWDKARKEERLLRDEFGDQYGEYQRRVRFIIPFLY